jgi:hypothetical protein
MNIKKQSFCIALVVLSVFLTGCASKLNQVQSGFLGDYSQLKSTKDFDNAKIFQAEGFDKLSLAAINEIKVIPFEIWIKQPQSNNPVFFNFKKSQELSAYFHQKLKQALQSDYRLVDELSSKTLTIQGAFSNIKLSEPELSVTDLIPVRLVLNAGNMAYLSATNQKDVITEVSIEVEFLLGEKSKRVFAMTATKQMDLTMKQSGDGFQVVTEVLDTWIDNFVKKLASIRQGK